MPLINRNEWSKTQSPFKENKIVARKMQNAKRANKPNQREERNSPDYRSRRPRFDDNVVDFREASTTRKKKVELIPRNVAQERYIDYLENQNNHIVFAMGPAGCGKTLLATLYAIKALQNGEVEKIIITRPAVSVDEQHGFLPGSLIEKMMPWMMPIVDVFKEHYSPLQFEKMLRDEIVEFSPLAYMRGRTFKNAIVIADEMQNSNVNQMKMVLTRIGDGAKMIITGDLSQADRGYESNGLRDFTSRLQGKGSNMISVVNFGSKDVERHVVIEEILRMYGE